MIDNEGAPMTMDCASVADLGAALAELSDIERTALEGRLINVAVHCADTGAPRVAAVFQALGVLVAEEGDRRAELIEHARHALDGDEEGCLLTDETRPETP